VRPHWAGFPDLDVHDHGPVCESIAHEHDVSHLDIDGFEIGVFAGDVRQDLAIASRSSAAFVGTQRFRTCLGMEASLWWDGVKALEPGLKRRSRVERLVGRHFLEAHQRGRRRGGDVVYFGLGQQPLGTNEVGHPSWLRPGRSSPQAFDRSQARSGARLDQHDHAQPIGRQCAHLVGLHCGAEHAAGFRGDRQTFGTNAILACGAVPKPFPQGIAVVEEGIFDGRRVGVALAVALGGVVANVADDLLASRPGFNRRLPGLYEGLLRGGLVLQAAAAPTKSYARQATVRQERSGQVIVRRIVLEALGDVANNVELDVVARHPSTHHIQVRISFGLLGTGVGCQHEIGFAALAHEFDQHGGGIDADAIGEDAWRVREVEVVGQATWSGWPRPRL